MPKTINASFRVDADEEQWGTSRARELDVPYSQLPRSGALLVGLLAPISRLLINLTVSDIINAQNYSRTFVERKKELINAVRTIEKFFRDAKKHAAEQEAENIEL